MWEWCLWCDEQPQVSNLFLLNIFLLMRWDLPSFFNSPLHLHVLCIRDRCPWAERTWRWELKSEIWKNEGVCDLKTISDVSQFTSACDNTCRGAWSWRGGLSAGLYICVGLVGAHVSHLIRPACGISATGQSPLSDSSVCHTLKLCWNTAVSFCLAEHWSLSHLAHSEAHQKFLLSNPSFHQLLTRPGCGTFFI